MTDTVSFAGIPFSANYSHKFLESMLRDYLSDSPPEFDVSVPQAIIDEERRNNDSRYSDGYIESLAFYRLFCTKAAACGTILFHSCVMETGGKAYLFAAPSGTGKTTHGKLWLSTFGEDKVRFLNGDKPLLRIIDGVPTAFGTPYRGKEKYGSNTSAPIGGICFLSRGIENTISQINSHDAMSRALPQLFIPHNGENADIIIKTLINILNSVPLWSMECNISEEAAKMSFSAMTGGKI